MKKVSQEKVSQLLMGAIDLHVHSGPGVIHRALDHMEAAQEAMDGGLRALVLKDQHSMTCNSAYIIKKYTFSGSDLNIYGGLPLNNAAGGLSPLAVDAAIDYGAKIIWMPTISAKHHIEWTRQSGVKKKTYWSAFEREEIPLTVLDQTGKLLPEVSEICSLIAKGDIVLSLGHLSLKEMKVLVDEAKRLGVKKILMNHPEFIINASIDDMIEFADKGVLIEHTYTLVVSDRVTKEYLAEMIRKVGAERTIISSDLGQVGRPHPVEGFRLCIADMLEMGITDEEIDLLFKKNPAMLLNL